ncbi:hypothetical protein [Nocardioides sp. TF02-7]|uniref:hypothetical protein n=1 Tax=Nocardioides sp. TF02-7 TaxID=2917724 RepID=UPI001F053E35|nr:hypothetical protein [Nocardioides sp. TF02-7]UMG94268.1 hypothetical protein MF408_09760 [Nocardioides sp. TF02-7]
MTTAPAPPAAQPGRTATAPARRHVVAAHAVAWCVVPAGLWRLLLGAGLTLGFDRAHLEADGMPGWGTAYVVPPHGPHRGPRPAGPRDGQALGEVVPRWVPVLRGRRIPTVAVVVPAALGALASVLLWTFTVVGLLSVEGSTALVGTR